MREVGLWYGVDEYETTHDTMCDIRHMHNAQCTIRTTQSTVSKKACLLKRCVSKKGVSPKKCVSEQKCVTKKCDSGEKVCLPKKVD